MNVPFETCEHFKFLRGSAGRHSEGSASVRSGGTREITLGIKLTMLYDYSSLAVSFGL